VRNMPRMMPLFLHRSRFVARRRRGVGGGRRRHGVHVPRGPPNHNQNGAGPVDGAAPAVQPLAPPPPFWCSEHGWVVCPLHEYGSAVVANPAMAPPPEDEVVVIDGDDSPLQPPTASATGLSPTSIFEMGGSSSAATLDGDAIKPRLPPPTPMVVESGSGLPLLMPPSVARPTDAPRMPVREDDALDFVSTPTGASSFAFGSGVSSLTSAAIADAVAPPRLPSPTPATPPPPPRLQSQTPATPPPSPRYGARRRLVALGLPAPSPSSSGRGRRAGTWSPAALGLANSVGPGSRLPDDSSDEEASGGSSAGRR
jgi:hypothetical protein